MSTEYVTKFNVPVVEAMNFTNATCTLRTMYARVACWCAKMNVLLAGIRVNTTTPDSGEITPSSLSSTSASNSKTSARLKKRVIHEGVLKTFTPAWLVWLKPSILSLNALVVTAHSLPKINAWKRLRKCTASRGTRLHLRKCNESSRVIVPAQVTQWRSQH